MKKSLITSIMAVSAALCLCVTAQAQGPVVVSDKDDYSPGETAMFSTTGFQPGELLDFSVAVSDENGLWIPDVTWADIPADGSGGADVTYVVPETWANKTLQLTVMGLTSGLLETTTFTDDPAPAPAPPDSGGPPDSGPPTSGTPPDSGPPPNPPPVITCSDNDADLGAVVGCLGAGGFTHDFPVTYSLGHRSGTRIVLATFTKPDNSTVTAIVATVNDGDGDPLTVTLNGMTPPVTSSVTISGPGNGSAMFSVHITANDGNNPDVVSDCGGTANAQIVYDFHGFFPPLHNDATTKVKQGSTVPVKFQVTDCSGNVISTSNDTISVAYQLGSAPDGNPDVDDAGSSNGDTDFFRWDPTGMQDIFNLKTNTEYNVGNTYKITAHLGDGTTHDVSISIK